MTTKRKASPGAKAKRVETSTSSAPSADPYISIHNAGKYLGLYRASIHTLMLDGVLKWAPIDGRKYLFRDSVEAYKRELDAKRAKS